MHVWAWSCAAAAAYFDMYWITLNPNCIVIAAHEFAGLCRRCCRGCWLQLHDCPKSCMPGDKLCFGLIFASCLLLTGVQVQLQPPVQGLVPYGDDD